MSVYENLRHGSPAFPIGVHNTRYPDGFWLYPHIHREFEILVMQKGSGILYIDEKEYPINPGDGFFINSKALHLGKKTNTDPCEFYALVFAPEFFGQLGNDHIADKFIYPVMNNQIILPSVFNGKTSWGRELISMTDEINFLNRTKPAAHELEVKALLLCIWKTLFSNSSSDSASMDKGLENIKTAIEFIQKEYASPLTLEDIAECISMSREHFCRRFSHVMHMTPFEYLNRIRIDNSCRMLDGTNLSVGEIAEKCGFNSFSYFSKKFKEIVGMTPARYRTRHNNKNT